MKTIALMPVRNEAAMLPFSLDCLSSSCDVIMVYDQASTDSSRDICRQFPKVVLIESNIAAVCEVGRWKLLDAARDFDGHNLLWCTDADELISPVLFRAFLANDRERLLPGTVVEGLFHHLWDRPDRFRDDGSPYAPYWKEFGLVDNRTTDFDRSPALPLHQPRVPLGAGQTRLRSDSLHVLHLQWLMANENQVKQAWYRCQEWLDGKSAVEINQRYAITLPPARTRTSAVPTEWTEGLSFPEIVTGGITWQEKEILEALEQRGAEFFEPLEIWHIPKLGQFFRNQVGRRPRPDRSYRPPLSQRARHFARRVVAGTRRRLLA
jgi:hypothetical protein